jgi:ParB family chromosome partitioning protein
LELKKVKDEGPRRALLEEVKAPPPWHRQIGGKLLRLDLEALPPKKRALLEKKLKELRELLE